MPWQELVVLSKPKKVTEIHGKILTLHECDLIKDLMLWIDYNKKVPTPSEFVDVKAEITNALYTEISPCPDWKTGLWFYSPQSIRQWSGLRLGRNHEDHMPYNAWRGTDGVEIEFIDTKLLPIKEVQVPYCRRICGFRYTTMIQCSAFGSYSQIELSNAGILPFWADKCSEESAMTCPMRKAASIGVYPSANKNDIMVKKFRKWLRTRKGIR